MNSLLIELLAQNLEELKNNPETFLPFGWEDLPPSMWEQFDTFIDLMVDEHFSSSSQ